VTVDPEIRVSVLAVTTIHSLVVDAKVSVRMVVPYGIVFVTVSACRLSLYPKYENPPPRATSSIASVTSRVPVFVGENLNHLMVSI